jgi:multicomponent K+:H+ antiporter subunit G
MPPLSDIIVSLLLLASGSMVFIAALGLLRLPGFFDRMHAPALAMTLGSWFVTFASITYFSVHAGELQLHVWLIIIILSITVPVTTAVVARAALFRQREEHEGNVPPPLRAQADSERQAG